MITPNGIALAMGASKFNKGSVKEPMGCSPWVDSCPDGKKWIHYAKKKNTQRLQFLEPYKLELASKKQNEARFFLLVDLQEIFFRSRFGGRKKINKKALKMTS